MVNCNDVKEFYLPKSKILSSIISGFAYYNYTNLKRNDSLIGIFPNATTNITFMLNGSLKDRNNIPIKEEVFAVCTTPIKLKQCENIEMIIIQLHTYGLNFFSNIPSNKLINNSLSLVDIFSLQEIGNIKDLLYFASTTQAKISILEDFLLQKIDLKKMSKQIYYAHYLINQNSAISMDKLSELLCVTPRGLRKMFQRYYGMSPKFYVKIKRFNKSINQITLNTNNSLTNIALNCGYYDQAHFNKDFKIFTSISPGNFIKKKATINDFYHVVFEK